MCLKYARSATVLLSNAFRGGQLGIILRTIAVFAKMPAPSTLSRGIYYVSQFNSLIFVLYLIVCDPGYYLAFSNGVFSCERMPINES
jgi:hypothetical protein